MRDKNYLVGEVDGVDGVRELLEHRDELGIEHRRGDLGDLGHDEVRPGDLELVRSPPLGAVGGEVIHLLGKSEKGNGMKRTLLFF